MRGKRQGPGTFVICGVGRERAPWGQRGLPRALGVPIENRRYGRLKICATLARERAGASRGRALAKDELVIIDGDLHRLAFVQAALKNLFSQWIFQETFDRTAHRSRAVSR